VKVSPFEYELQMVLNASLAREYHHWCEKYDRPNNLFTTLIALFTIVIIAARVEPLPASKRTFTQTTTPISGYLGSSFNTTLRQPQLMPVIRNKKILVTQLGERLRKLHLDTQNIQPAPPKVEPKSD
jgi:hypothetical protein